MVEFQLQMFRLSADLLIGVGSRQKLPHVFHDRSCENIIYGNVFGTKRSSMFPSTPLLKALNII